jgi:hypothetical protein
MDDRRHDHDDRHGPEGTEFLDLEISRVIFEGARRLVRDVAMDIVRDAMRERLQERLGDRLAAAGRLAADELADDVETNLEIESRIAARRTQRESLEARLSEIFGGAQRGPPRPAKASRRKR